MADAVSDDPAVAEQARTRLAENVEDPEYPQVRAHGRGRQAQSVKPSAQPTLVRTQHLPPPPETAPDLRRRGLGLLLSSAGGSRLFPVSDGCSWNRRGTDSAVSHGVWSQSAGAVRVDREGPVDAAVRQLFMAVDAARVYAPQDFDTVAGAVGDFGSGDVGVEGQGDAAVA
jgi:hypothetical protein